LDGNAINITDTNFTELLRLCEEFAFSELAAKLSEFCPSIDFREAEGEDADARRRISALEEKANQHSHAIVMLQNEITQLSKDFERLVSEVSALRSAAAGIQTLSEEVSALKTQIAVMSPPCHSIPESAAFSISSAFSALSTHHIHSIPESDTCSVPSSTSALSTCPIGPFKMEEVIYTR
jgi:FtsZ-binding cell division protein ZapB